MSRRSAPKIHRDAKPLSITAIDSKGSPYIQCPRCDREIKLFDSKVFLVGYLEKVTSKEHIRVEGPGFVRWETLVRITWLPKVKKVTGCPECYQEYIKAIGSSKYKDSFVSPKI